MKVGHQNMDENRSWRVLKNAHNAYKSTIRYVRKKIWLFLIITRSGAWQSDWTFLNIGYSTWNKFSIVGFLKRHEKDKQD